MKTWPFAVASFAACAVGVGAAALFGRPALFGAVAASLGAACALAALVAFAGKGVNGVLGGFTAGFLVRALVLGVGLVASGARNDGAIPYVIAFFAVYAATQTVEVLFVHFSRSGATT